jgi:hypothetical protein
VIAFAGTDINAATTFLSITVDNPVSGAVADQFNALNNGSAFAGFPTAGFWTAHFSFHEPSRPRSFDMGHDAARLCRAELRELSGVPRNRRGGGIRGDRDSLSI